MSTPLSGATQRTGDHPSFTYTHPQFYDPNFPDNATSDRRLTVLQPLIYTIMEMDPGSALTLAVANRAFTSEARRFVRNTTLPIINLLSPQTDVNGFSPRFFVIFQRNAVRSFRSLRIECPNRILCLREAVQFETLRTAIAPFFIMLATQRGQIIDYGFPVNSGEKREISMREEYRVRTHQLLAEWGATHVFDVSSSHGAEAFRRTLVNYVAEGVRYVPGNSKILTQEQKSAFRNYLAERARREIDHLPVGEGVGLFYTSHFVRKMTASWVKPLPLAALSGDIFFRMIPYFNFQDQCRLTGVNRVFGSLFDRYEALAENGQPGENTASVDGQSSSGQGNNPDGLG